MNYRSLETLNRHIIEWIPRLSRDIDLIVGIPRSGLLVANMLSLYLNLPLTDLEGFVSSTMISSGQRSPTVNKKEFFRKKRNILVLDDSLCSGTQMRKARKMIEDANLSHNIYYAAVYVTPENRNMVDFFFEILPWPRVFEWNFLHHLDMQNWCVDIDGVLCRDPTDEENDDGEKYIHFLKTVDPVLVPSVRIGWLVTCRLEKYRLITEAWLKKIGIRYNNLFMMDFPDKAARIASGSHSSFKARIYESTGARLFIESSKKQSVEIARMSGRAVLCIETREMVYPSTIEVNKKRSKEFLHLFLHEPGEAFKKGYRFIKRSLSDT